MAKPQIENGHVDIANEIAEALCQINLSAYENRVVWAIFRKTYGWHKKWDRITFSQFQEITDLDRRHIGRTIRRLIGRNIVASRGNGQNIEYSFQKDYDIWEGKPLPKEAPTKGMEPLPLEGEPLPKEATKPLPKEAHTKERKETRQKKLDKRKHGEFNNVLLSEEEYQKLIVRFGESGTNGRIEELSVGIASKGYKYKSHYATILNWDRRDKEQKGGDHGAHRAGDRKLKARTEYRTPDEHRKSCGTG